MDWTSRQIFRALQWGGELAGRLRWSRMAFRLCALAALLNGAAGALRAAEAPGTESATEHFNFVVRPILAEHCFQCHGQDAARPCPRPAGRNPELSYQVVRDPVHVHDFHATLLHLPGIEHERFTFRYQGRDFRLTDVSGTVVKAVLA